MTLRTMALAAALTAAVLIPGQAQDQAQTPAKKPVAWKELAAALDVLPKTSTTTWIYSPPLAAKREFSIRIASLSAKGDIVPAIVERLSAANPKTEEQEAETLNLVRILKQRPDERVLAALERLAAMTPPTSTYTMDEGRILRYPFNIEAGEVVREIKIDQAKRQWERELAGQDKSVRMSALADGFMSQVENSEGRWYAAGSMLRAELSPNERLELIESRIGRFLPDDTPWKVHVTDRLAVLLEELGNLGADRTRVTQLLERIAREAVTESSRNYSAGLLERLRRKWRTSDAPR